MDSDERQVWLHLQKTLKKFEGKSFAGVLNLKRSGVWNQTEQTVNLKFAPNQIEFNAEKDFSYVIDLLKDELQYRKPAVIEDSMNFDLSKLRLLPWARLLSISRQIPDEDTFTITQSERKDRRVYNIHRRRSSDEGLRLVFDGQESKFRELEFLFGPHFGAWLTF